MEDSPRTAWYLEEDDKSVKKLDDVDGMMNARKFIAQDVQVSLSDRP